MGKLALVIKSVASALAFLVSPIGITIAAIGAIVAAVVILYNKFEGVRKVVNGVIDIFVEFIKIMTEGAQAFFRGFKNLSEGNFKAAAKDFGEALRKSNPITAAITEGKRLGAAFMGGYEDETNRLSGVFSKLSASVGGGAAGMPSGGGAAVSAPTITGGGGERRTAPKPLKLLDTQSLELASTQINSIRDSNKEIVESMKESLAVTKERVDGEFDKKLAEQSEAMAKNFSFIQSAITPIIDGVFQALEKGTNIFKSITQSVKQLIIQLVKAVAQAAILSAVMNLIFPGAGAAGQFGFKTIFKGLLGFANGGLVTGPTVGSNPEVVAPLDKLKSMLDGVMGGGDFVASTRLAGSDLLLVVERAQRERGR
jgi:phage-related protein